jgi:hypothetical protein
MEQDRVPTRTSALRICTEIAALAGLTWTEEVVLLPAIIAPPELDRLDPFFDSLGCWDEKTRTIRVDLGRCSLKSGPSPSNALVEAVAAHFCAEAVVQLGVHPRTGNSYVRWNDPSKVFAKEGYPLRPVHRFYDALVREQQLFTQIFTSLYLAGWHDAAVTTIFDRLSHGHCGLYALNYSDSLDARLVDPLLARPWASEIKADPSGTAQAARQALGWLTREVPVGKEDMWNFDE